MNSFENSVATKPNEIVAKTRFESPSPNLARPSVLLILNGSTVGGSKAWNDCTAPAVLGCEAAGISTLLGSVVDAFSMVNEANRSLGVSCPGGRVREAGNARNARKKEFL